MTMPWNKSKDEENKPTSEGDGTETKQGTEGDQKTTESNSQTPQTDTGAQSPFRLPSLEGKSEQELSDLLAVQEMTIREQKAALEGAQAAPTVEPEPEPKPEPVEISSEDFFADPSGSTRKIMDESTTKIIAEMKTMVAPLEAQFAKGFAKDAWAEAIEQVPDVAGLRPAIEAVLSKNGITSPSIAQILGSRDMAYGHAQRQGVTLPGMETAPASTPAPTTENTRVIPQHSVSTQPLAATEKKVTIKPLDENEARMARERKMTPEQFRSWQDLPEDEVLTPVPEQVT